jgi:hypothetical protein
MCRLRCREDCLDSETHQQRRQDSVPNREQKPTYPSYPTSFVSKCTTSSRAETSTSNSPFQPGTRIYSKRPSQCQTRNDNERFLELRYSLAHHAQPTFSHMSSPKTPDSPVTPIFGMDDDGYKIISEKLVLHSVYLLIKSTWGCQCASAREPLAMTYKAMAILNSFVNNIFERIATEASSRFSLWFILDILIYIFLLLILIVLSTISSNGLRLKRLVGFPSDIYWILQYIFFFCLPRTRFRF